MPLWGRNDQAVTANSTTTRESSNGAPIGTYALVKQGGGSNAHFGNTSAGSRAATDVAMFNNTTPSAFLTGQAVGVFGLDASETAISSGNLVFGRVTFGGSGYTANATVTIVPTNGGTSGVANAFANTTAGIGGHITAINISTPGSGYITNPTITISAPTAQTFNANTGGVVNASDVILMGTANSRYQAGDRLFYGVPTGNTAVPNLVGNTFYFVSFANTTSIALSTTPGGANVDLVAPTTAEQHTLTGDTATGVIVTNGAKNKGVAHAGWVVRTEGTGGRAGRVQYETLVAMGSLGQQGAAYGTAATVADSTTDDAIHTP